MNHCPLPPGHRHGHTDDYPTGCRCPDTEHANQMRLAVQRHRNRQIRMGRAEPDTLVNPSPARQRVAEWDRDGVLTIRILAGTGITADTLGRLRRKEGMIRRSSSDAILAWVPGPADILPGRYVPALGTMHRLRALAALGYAATAVAEHIAAASSDGTGPDETTLTRIRAGNRKGTSPRVRADVAAAYEALWDQRPDESNSGLARAAGYARTLATRHGWLPPMYLDDDRMEDPSYRPTIPRPRRTTGNRAAQELQNR